MQEPTRNVDGKTPLDQKRAASGTDENPSPGKHQRTEEPAPLATEELVSAEGMEDLKRLLDDESTAPRTSVASSNGFLSMSKSASGQTSAKTTTDPSATAIDQSTPCMNHEPCLDSQVLYDMID